MGLERSLRIRLTPFGVSDSCAVGAARTRQTGPRPVTLVVLYFQPTDRAETRMSRHTEQLPLWATAHQEVGALLMQRLAPT
jgi:hypothetical protein